MKSNNRKLLIVWLVTTTVYALLIVGYLESIWLALPFDRMPYWVSELYTYLCFGGAAVPAFCLQTLLCRALKRRWLKWLPLTVLFAWGGVLCILASTASGWDSLGYLILLLLCAAPALGFVSGWIVYAAQKKKKER